MCVCVYVCVCIRARAHVHTHIYMHIYIHTYIYMYAYICVCVNWFFYTWRLSDYRSHCPWDNPLRSTSLSFIIQLNLSWDSQFYTYLSRFMQLPKSQLTIWQVILTLIISIPCAWFKVRRRGSQKRTSLNTTWNGLCSNILALHAPHVSFGSFDHGQLRTNLN